MRKSNKVFQVMRKHNKVLFLDLDGTLIETKSGKTFPENCEDWQFKEGILHAIGNYEPSHLFIVTNQGGIESGFVDYDEWMEKIGKIMDYLSLRFPFIEKIETAVEITNEKHNHRRKPNPGMLEELYEEHKELKKKEALMVGDASGLEGQFSDSDLKTAENFGIDYLDVGYFIKCFAPCSRCDANVCVLSSIISECKDVQACKDSINKNIKHFKKEFKKDLEQWKKRSTKA